jgi:hypothetical protein
MAGVETGDVNMSRETALLKGLSKRGVVDVVVVEDPKEDGEIVVAIWADVSKGEAKRIRWEISSYRSGESC